MDITIRDVAKEAQVSVSTVSRVFNHDHLVKQTTRERVRKIAQQMGYAPNALAKGLSLGQTQAVGVLIPAPHGEFFSEFIRGLDEVSQAAQYHLLVSSSHHRTEEGRAVLNALTGRVDGLVIMATHARATVWSKWLNPSLPVVFVNTAMEGASYDAFGIENREGAACAMRHLIETGRTRIAAITGPAGFYDVEERLAGYQAALREKKLQSGPVLEGAFTQESGYQAGQRLAAMERRPDAVFAFNDRMAIGAMAAFQEAGLRIPADVAVVGFDDTPSAHYMNPPLTSVRVPIYDIGRLAAQRLFERLQAVETLKREVCVLPYELKVRASTKP